VYTNFTDAELVGVPDAWKPLYRRIWDVTDYVIPPSEYNAFFVTTNVVITPDQVQGECPEDPKVPGAICDPKNNTCRAGKSSQLGHGVYSGECVPADLEFLTPEEKLENNSTFVCAIMAWCPVEKDIQPLNDRYDNAQSSGLEMQKLQGKKLLWIFLLRG
jgi:P2X purinoceptor 4